jgi:hypothetical protein
MCDACAGFGTPVELASASQLERVTLAWRTPRGGCEFTPLDPPLVTVIPPGGLIFNPPFVVNQVPVPSAGARPL